MTNPAPPVDDARDPVVPEHALHNAVLTFGIANGLDDAGEAETYRDALRDVLREFMRDNMNAPSPTADEARTVDDDTLLRLIKTHFGHKARCATVRIDYKDGIDIDVPTHEIRAFAAALLSRFPSEEASAIVLPAWDSLPVGTRVQIVETAFADTDKGSDVPSSLEYYEAIREVLGRITRAPGAGT